MKNEELITLSLPYRSGKNRTVRVYLPPREDGEKLPVIYMTDGQNLYEDGRAGQLGCWFTRETVRAELESSGRAAIIVGIHNDEGAEQRTCELTPKGIGEVKFPPDLPSEMKERFRPEGEIFDDFTVNTVMPEIENRFPVLKGRNATAFCGSSSGGLQSVFTVMSHPDKFCMGGVFSPAFVLYESSDIVRFIADNMTENAPYLYIYSGAGDELERDIFESTEQVSDAFSEFYPFEKHCEIFLLEQRHHESAWEPIFKDFLHTFLLRREEF